ncbi:MAG: HD domain-containing protein [Spirochaetales bacterium]|jgi:putative nucleotidyltransferase with HDIG domain|uniref:HD/PDEase domain-containing protein n=1 Tax=uncultured Spirochaetota bacterium TaxID=460511 RepID=A0A652ZX99_9SPIR|nr:HD domain-containing protein [Spirochaetia bacterium]MDD3820975.1 HD domain-containing protein [Spirochaetales bacterium]NLX46521.1 HD domain-containing protein [Treponema sp.]VBB40438.1 conserved hypothetical protein [uncultured Spirochaetota bacterium]HAP55907.1 hypothetical protein [Spirochaetaceae bacterium]
MAFESQRVPEGEARRSRRRGYPSYEEALRLLRSYVSDEKTLKHSIACAETAFEMAETIHRRHPELPLDPEKVRVGGLLHDIGKARPGEHELNSVAILREEGIPELADIVLHSYPYEIFLCKGEERPEYLPRSLENKIVVYADFLRDQEAREVGMEERIAGIRARKRDETERMAALKLAEPRLLRLKDEIEALLS